MISVELALKTILARFCPLGLEKTPLLESLHRVSGEDLYASRNIPQFANSAMDGYAVRCSDIKNATKRNPAALKIIEDIPAGQVPRKELTTGTAARIMTGAIIPRGADAVIRQEDSKKNAKTVYIFTAAEQGRDIRPAGEDVKKDELVIGRGTVLKPAVIGMLAALGYSSVQVYRRPRVAIVATGDELVDINDAPAPGKIVNSNSYALAAQVLACGGIPVMLGITPDKKPALKKKFNAALRSDLIISSGGVSVGDFDFVKNVMGEIGNSMHFWQVAMRPGKPLAFGNIKGTPLFGLPGNPVSAMVSFEQFVRPCLLKMQGHTKIFRQTVKAVNTGTIKKKAGFKHFIRAVVRREKDKYLASATGNQGSGILKSMVLANALIVLAEDVTQVKKGGTVAVQLLDNSPFSADKT